MESPPPPPSFLSMGPLEIPRPKCQGMQFVPTRGRYGFYRTIRAEGASFGVEIKAMGPRRPALSKDLFLRPQAINEEDEHDISNGGSLDSVHTTSSSASSQVSSNRSDRSSPVEIEPDYPIDEPDYPQDDLPSPPPASRLTARAVSAPSYVPSSYSSSSHPNPPPSHVQAQRVVRMGGGAMPTRPSFAPPPPPPPPPPPKTVRIMTKF